MKVPLVIAASCSLICAQSTLHVGVGQPYSDPAAAIAAASPGDRVLVHAGTYAEFVLNKGLHLRAEPPSAVVVIQAVSQGVAVELPAGQTAVVEGLRLDTSLRVRPPLGQSAAGVLSVADATFSRGITNTDAHVVMRQCTVDGGPIGTGLVCAVNLAGTASFSAVQSTISGGYGWAFSAPGILATQQAEVHLCQCVVTGGFGGGHPAGAWILDPGVRLTNAARGWFVDCTIQARLVFNGNVVGLDNQSSNSAFMERTITRDSAGVSPATSGSVLNGLVLGLSSSTPLVRGGVFQLDFRSRPGFPIVAHGTLVLSTPATYAVLAQRDLGFVTNSVMLSFGVADALGRSTTSVPIPNLTALLDLPVWFAGWSGDSFPVQLAPTLGGLIR